MRKVTLVLGAVALSGGLSLAGCSSASSTVQHRAVNGTEVITGSVRGKAAAVSAPVIRLTLTGPVDTTSSITLTGGSKGVLRTPAGSLYVTHSKGKTTRHVSARTCVAGFGNTGTVRVTGGTGKFAGASGSGVFGVTFSGVLPRKNGKCDTSPSARPVASTAIMSFRAALELKLGG